MNSGEMGTHLNISNKAIFIPELPQLKFGQDKLCMFF